MNWFHYFFLSFLFFISFTTLDLASCPAHSILSYCVILFCFAMFCCVTIYQSYTCTVIDDAMPVHPPSTISPPSSPSLPQCPPIHPFTILLLLPPSQFLPPTNLPGHQITPRLRPITHPVTHPWGPVLRLKKSRAS
ncbi:hypothetical protein HOY80DRAFT_621323 [Tuber brumale]|nr:hypothetical protein HOY80DRAFT_621323 [Tuber brumale]